MEDCSLHLYSLCGFFVGVRHERQYTQDPADPRNTADEVRGWACTDCYLLYHRNIQEDGTGCVTEKAEHLQPSEKWSARRGHGKELNRILAVLRKMISHR